jgi:DNA-binding MarR family transcriptional regulator
VDDRQSAPGEPQVVQRLGIAFLTWRRYVQRHVTAHDITLKQSFVLGRLAEQDGCLLPSRIALLLFCDRPTATVIVKNMEKRGWVRRERDTEDRRQKRVTITEAGRQKLAEIQEQVWEPLEAAFDPLGCLNHDEIETLDGLLARLVKHLRQLE